MASAMGGSGWASDLMGAGAGLAIWFALGRLSEMILELARNVMFARVATAAEESISAPAFMAALTAPPGSSLSAIEVAKRVENQSARIFLSFVFNHMGGMVGDMVAMTFLAVSIGAGRQFLWALPATAGVVVIGWWAQGLSKKILGPYDELGGYAKMLSRSGELLSKAALAKAYGSEAAYMRLRMKASEESRAELTAYRGSDVWIIHLSPALAGLAMAALFALGAHELDGSVASGAAFGASVAALGAAFARAQQMSFAFEGLATSLAELDKSLDAADGARALALARVPGETSGPKAGPGVLRVCGLVARRPGLERPAAMVRALSVASGEILWIVGGSGAGKSTLLGAATGTLPHDEGEILWSESPASSWSELCAWVPQASTPAPGSLAWNLRLGRAGASDGELWDALSEVGMRARVEAAGGLESNPSVIGLSGGEAQRVSIARALVSRRPLVALDEPTSALDAVNDALAVSAIGALARAGAAVLVASHRLASIPAGSRVLCMDCGVVAEEGVLESLIAGSGPFATLWEASLRSGGEDE